MKQKEIHGKYWIFCALLMAGVILFAVTFFLQQNEEQMQEQNTIYMQNTAMQTASRIDDILEMEKHSIVAMADLYGKMMTSPDPEVELLEEITEESMFDYVEYADREGISRSLDGQSADVSDRSYFKKAMKGESSIDIVYDSSLSHQTLVVFVAPLYYQEKVVGALLGAYQEERMQQIMEETYFGEKSVSYLCEKDGTVIAHSGLAEDTENIIDFYSGDRLDEDGQRKLMNSLRNRVPYSFTLEGNDGTTSAYLAKLSQVEWCIIQTYPSSAAAESVSKLNRTGMMLMICVTVAFGVYILLILVSSRRRRKVILQEKDEMERIVDGINRLFARFVIVDLEQDTYRYLEDYSNSPSTIPRQGKYGDFVEYFQKRILETLGEVKLEDVLTADYLHTHLAGNTPYISYNFKIRREQAEHWEIASFICLSRREDGSPRTLLFAIQDVTALQQREEKSRDALRTALEAAREASSAKSDFLSRMSHDMRTPLNAILGMARIGRGHLEEPSRMEECLDKIEGAGEQLLQLVNHLLDLSKIESRSTKLQEEVFSIGECLQEVEDMFQPQIEEKQLTFLFPGNQVRHDYVCGDMKRLRRILINIIENAVKYTPSGGKISLWTCEKDINMVHSACYEFHCLDTGVGISEEMRKRIFEPFFSSEDSRIQKTDSLGLGLSIAQGFAKMMDGGITVENPPEGGSHFIVRVRLKLGQDRKPKEEEPKAQEEIRYDGRRVLLVEDNEINAEIAAEFLDSFGIETDVAVNGREALSRLLEEEVCPYDLIFMDIQMPVMNGYEATRAIRKAERDDLQRIPIIALTANAFQEDIHRARKAGMNAHLTKPINFEQLAETLRQYLSD